MFIEMKMTGKITFAALMATLLFGACSTTQKLYDAGSYDEVIQRLAPRATTGHLSNRNFNLLANSYHAANQSDHERIIQLKTSGQPDVWSEVYQRYRSMNGRCKALSRMSNGDKQAMNYTKLDLDSELSVSKLKAERYLAAKANALLAQGDENSIAEAKKMVIQLQRTNPENTEIATLKQKLMVSSAKSILLTFDNNSRNRLSAEFVNTLLKTSPEQPKVTIVEQRHADYDLVVNIRLDEISASPEHTDAVAFEEENNGKKVQVTDKTDSKSLTIKGMIEYYEENGNVMRLAMPFEVVSTFKHDYAEINGDVEACSPQTLEMVKAGRVPFPTNESLAIDAASKLNSLLMEQLK